MNRTGKKKSLSEAFWRLVDKSEDCWEWKASCRGGRFNQYGNFRGKMAHRVSWEMANGQIPDGMRVCHHCDNPKCVRPDHLFLGTDRDNSADMMRKMRKPTKLNWEKVAEIRRLCADGMRQSEIADKYGMSRAAICLIVNRKQWALDAR